MPPTSPTLFGDLTSLFKLLVVVGACGAAGVFACAGEGQIGGPAGTGGQGQPGSGGTTSPGTGGTVAGSGGAVAGTGGVVGTGGAGSGTGGRTGGTSAGTGGSATGTGGAAVGTGGSAGRAGTGGAAGRANTGGAAGRGTGGTGTGGTVAGTGGAPIPTTPPPNCGSSPLNQKPFGCTFSWGRNNPGGALNSFSYLGFMSNWVGSNIRADGTFPNCQGCTWLSGQVASTNLIPVFYAYFIGYYGHANGLPDGNLGGPPNLTTGGAALIRNNRAKVIQMHQWYAQQAYAVWKTKPLVWLLDGDYVQYTNASQTNPLTYAELAQLTAEITCVIKATMPNAVVAINHSAWNANEVTNGFWGAMATANVYYDLVWTTGKGDANGFFDATTTAASYNGATAKYSYLRAFTGRKIFVDTSFGASAMGDSWSNTTAANLNARIAEGVIAANVTGTVPSNYQSAISGLAPSLSMTCP